MILLDLKYFQHDVIFLSPTLNILNVYTDYKFHEKSDNFITNNVIIELS